MRNRLCASPSPKGDIFVIANVEDKSSLAHRAGRHRPEEPDIGGSGARRPKLGGKAVAPREGVGELPRTLDLGATRYRDFQRDGGEGLEQVTPEVKSNVTNKERWKD